MATFDTSDAPTPRVSPELIVGATSPLWSYFGAVAAGGVAFWWMTRWTQPVNLEALFAQTLKAATPAPALEAPAEAALEAPVEAVTETIETAPPPAPEPVVEPEPVMVAPEPEPAPPPEPILEAAPEPLLEATPKSKAKKSASADGDA